jgi:hypothetical protein
MSLDELVKRFPGSPVRELVEGALSAVQEAASFSEPRSAVDAFLDANK